MTFKSGFVTVIGRPNVGKSTLINFLIGRKISIMSPKPQTTRNTIRAILTNEESQIIFLDTPGIHNPKNKLGTYMLSQALNTLKDIDCIIYIVEPIAESIDESDLKIIESLKQIDNDIVLIINKIDKWDKKNILLTIDKFSKQMDFAEIIPISALEGDNTQNITALITNYLDEGPMYFNKEDLTDQAEKVIVSEFIREKILLYLRDEIPHGVGVEIMKFTTRDNSEIIDIEATIYCEKKSHKGIIIGKKGTMLKKIGSSSRTEIEKLLGNKVYLTLWVKIKEGWRNSNYMLKNLGYSDNE